MLLDVFTTLGAVPATVPLAEVYAAAQTHLVDAMAVSLGGIETSKYYEVQKYPRAVTSHNWAEFVRRERRLLDAFAGRRQC